MCVLWWRLVFITVILSHISFGTSIFRNVCRFFCFHIHLLHIFFFFRNRVRRALLGEEKWSTSLGDDGMWNHFRTTEAVNIYLKTVCLWYCSNNFFSSSSSSVEYYSYGTNYDLVDWIEWPISNTISLFVSVQCSHSWNEMPSIDSVSQFQTTKLILNENHVEVFWLNCVMSFQFSLLVFVFDILFQNSYFDWNNYKWNENVDDELTRDDSYVSSLQQNHKKKKKKEEKCRWKLKEWQRIDKEKMFIFYVPTLTTIKWNWIKDLIYYII